MTTEETKITLPNSSATLVLGILSVLFGCVVVGLVLGIIGLVISKEGRNLYMADPDKYSGYGALNAGRVLCIIGVVLGGILTARFIFVIAIGGALLGGVLGILGL